jgi:stringent starvation protein B
VKPRRPYLLRALYEWIVDSGEIPNVLIDAEIDGVVVPEEHVRDGQIVLNISPQAVRNLNLGDDFVMCEGRFSGRSMELILPIISIRAIYCRDSGQGLAFDDEDMHAEDAEAVAIQSAEILSEDAGKRPDNDGPRPTLRLV